MPAKSTYKPVFTSALVAILCGIVVAACATYLDWRINPSGIFHSGGQIHWNIVLDTAISWFLPITAVVFLLVLAAISLAKKLR